jgi:hypothetical protein
VNAIAFVVQAGDLEKKAVLLAISLRNCFGDGVALLAGHAEPHAPLRERTRRILDEVGVVITPIENPLAADYKIGNKIAVCRLLGGFGRALLLDSDILALGAPPPLLPGVAAVPASYRHCGTPVWARAYAVFGLGLSGQSTTSAVSREAGPPYFNAGVVAFSGVNAASFADIWADSAARLDVSGILPPQARRPYLDQIALPIAAARMGQAVTPLDLAWNHPGWHGPAPDIAATFLLHYQCVARLRTVPDLAPLLAAFEQRYRPYFSGFLVD